MALKEKLGQYLNESKLSEKINELAQNLDTRNLVIDEKIKTAELDCKKKELQWKQKCSLMAEQYQGTIKGIK